MGSLMQDLKRQASFFLREKIKTARLVLMDVTPVQILTEEITNDESSMAPPDAQAMKLISKAAFEVDDYERVVHVLHQRLSKFDAQNWRASYKALILLEHLLTHGPQRVAEEFESDQEIIKDMSSFHYLDDKGFNWGSSVRKKSERVMRLVDDRSYLKEERARARKLTVGIKGFGSAIHISSSSSVNDGSSKDFLRSKTHQYFTSEDYDHHDHAVENEVLESDEYMKKLLMTERMTENEVKGRSHAYSSEQYGMERDHPFWDKEHRTRVSLLSSV